MNIIRDPDAVIDAWLADGPQRLPDGTRHAIAVGVRAIPRRRPSLQWNGSFFALSSAAVVVVVVALAFGIYVNRPGPNIGVQPTPTASPSASPSPAPSPSPTLSPTPLPTPSALTSRFTSTVHGVSIGYPTTWEVRPATEAWNQGAFTFDATGVDVIFDPTHQDDLYLSISSAPLGDQSAEDWCCSELWAAAEVCESGGNFGRFTLDGASALVRGCDGFANRFEDHVVQAATATHGYVIYLHVAQDPALQALYTEAWFDAVLETVDLP